jgi:hypothetical protein
VNRFLKTLLLLLGATLVARGDELPTGPDTLLVNPAQNAAWKDLFAQLQPNKNRQSKFEERRYFPFRKMPVVLKGEIRIIPDRGLSLRYLEPERRILIVDAKGLLMRDEEGRESAAPSDRRAEAVVSALVSVLRFDLPTLEKSFEVHGKREGDAWTLAFVPLEPTLIEFVGVLAVSGHKGTLDRIEMFKSPKQRIEILISGTQENVLFAGDVLHRFFR